MGTYDTIGGTPRHDPAFDEEPTCEVCYCYDCICPECPVCSVHGDPRCYIGTRGDKHDNGDHGMQLTQEQLEARGEEP